MFNFFIGCFTIIYLILALMFYSFSIEDENNKYISLLTGILWLPILLHNIIKRLIQEKKDNNENEAIDN